MDKNRFENKLLFYSRKAYTYNSIFSSIQGRVLRRSDLLGNEFVQPFVAINGYEAKYRGVYQCIQINPMGPMIPGVPGGVRLKEF